MTPPQPPPQPSPDHLTSLTAPGDPTPRRVPSSARVTRLDLAAVPAPQAAPAAQPVQPAHTAPGAVAGDTLSAAAPAPPRRDLAALLVVPLLVAAVGLLVLLSSHVSMRDSVTLMTNARFAEISEGVAHRVLAPFHQAHDLIARLDDARRLSPPGLYDPTHLGLRLLALLRDHPALAWVTLSTPDGHHLGALIEDDGSLRLNHVTPSPAGTTLHQYAPTPAFDALTPIERRPTPYDPRLRPFYALAASTPNALRWTAPYLFYDRGVYGVSATQTLHDAPSGPIAAVATVDFDLQSLSRLLSRIETVPEGAAVIFDSQGQVLAYSRSTLRAALNQRDAGDAATADTFHDPTLQAFFAAKPHRLTPKGTQSQALTFQVDGEPYLGSVTPFSIGDDQRWFIGVFAPEAVLMAPVRRTNGYSLLVSAVGLLLGIAVATWVTNRIHRAQSAAQRAAADALRAEADARAARQQAQDLGSYALIERLGQGGMGEVWRAQHAMLARPAAIKLIKPNPDQTPNAAAFTRERFFQEARATAQLRSRHTIAIYDFGVSDDLTLFYVMELLDGIDLETLVQRFGPLPAGRVVHFLCQACASLSEAHAAGLIHRDIKPANLYAARIADEVDVVKVLDFGLVIHARSDQRTPDGHHRADFAGTPSYMAPEQIGGQPLDGRADLYALGCVAYWLMTARLVFPASTVTDAMRAHLHEAPLPPSSHGLPVNPHLEAVVLRCLAKSPDARYPTADALRDALRAIPFTDHERWDDARAHAWWRAHAPDISPDAPTADATAVPPPTHQDPMAAPPTVTLPNLLG